MPLSKNPTRLARSRVKRGMRWLDQLVPGWEERIVTEMLDLSDGHACICGQVFMEQAKGWVPLKLTAVDLPPDCDPEEGPSGFGYAYEVLLHENEARCNALGFDADEKLDYEELQHAWERALLIRAREKRDVLVEAEIALLAANHQKENA